jgi:DNA-binding NarL/FixJ family response regulator
MSERSSTLKRPRVLLADDNSPLLAVETALLTPYFDVVGTATDGGKLVSEALRLEPDVTVADITMPVLSGIEAAHQLRELGLSVPLVFLTIHAEEEFVMACKAEGALGYVLKAKMKTQLVSAVHSALAGVSFLPPPVSV